MRIASPRLPEWYVQDVPAFLARHGGALHDMEVAALLVIWGSAWQAVQEGRDPLWRYSDVVRLLMESLGLDRASAYRRLKRLTQRTYQGKRLLKVGLAREWVSTQGGGEEEGSAPDGVSSSDRGSNLMVTLGEAFAADLARVRRRLASSPHVSQKCDSLTNEIPHDKRGTLKKHGGVGEHDFLEISQEISPPPPPDFHGRLTSETRLTNETRRTDETRLTYETRRADETRRTDANPGEEIRAVLEEAGVLPPNAAALALELARRGWSPHALRAWLEDYLPELRQAAQRSGGDPAALLVWRLKNAAEPPPEADAEEPLPPLRPLRPEEQAAWEAALARMRQELPIPARGVLDDLEAVGIAEQGEAAALIVQVRTATPVVRRVVGTGVFRRALVDAFGREMGVILQERSEERSGAEAK